MLHSSIRLQDVRRLLRSAVELELSADSVQRLKWFQYALEHEGNVSLTCRHFGISRSTFLRWAKRFDATDIKTLEEESRRPHTLRTSKADDKVVAAVSEIRKSQPLLGKEAIVQLLKAQGFTTSASTVGRIITRYKLFFAETTSHREKRFIGEELSAEEISSKTNKVGTTSADTDTDSPFSVLNPGLTS